MGDFVDIVFKNSSLDTTHALTHHHMDGFHNAYLGENCMDMDIIKLESFFLDENVTNTRVATRIQKLKLPIKALNKSKMVKAKTYVVGRKQALDKEGVGSSRIQIEQKLCPISLESR